MKSHNTSIADRNGFTLMEMLLVVGIFLTLISMGVIMSMSHMQQTSLMHDRDTLLSLLWHARARALANVDEAPHGVHITDTAFISFSGTAYDEQSTYLLPTAHSDHLTFSGDTTILFAPLTGDALSGSRTITLSKETEHATISVNVLGQIDW